ncbi:MAG: sigma-E factor negative regulatory protein [Burkholderiales bacterium]
MFDDSEANTKVDAAARERLSALLDGELDATPVTQACAHWRESGEAKAAWHAYHLIGDVMRSDDLASDPGHDASFLSAFRARLTNEPVVLAPRPLESATPVLVAPAAVRAVGAGGSGRRWSWMAPTAVAAGFVAVAGVLTLTRVPSLSGDGAAGTSIAQAAAPAAASFVGGSPTPVATLVNGGAQAVEPPSSIATGQMIRDVRLDRYLAAHKQFAGSSALGVPSTYLRNATAEISGR